MQPHARQIDAGRPLDTPRNRQRALGRLIARTAL
jgi:hypothetical protein